MLQFADIVNAHDFIDTIVQSADTERFLVGVCVRSDESNIGRPVYEERTPHWLIPGTSKANMPRAVRRLARLLREFDADVLHTHHFEQAVIGWLATRLHRRTRLVVGRHYSDAIYRSSAGVRRRALLALEQRVNRAAARIIVPSSLIKRILTERQGIDAGKIDMIHYGFAPQKYSAPRAEDVERVRAELGTEGRFVLSTFGRLHEEKGHRFMLAAMRELKESVPNVLWLVVGEGGERAALEEAIRAAKLEREVRLLGWRRDAMTVMAASDAVVQPTLHEAFSQVMIEALWMRRALVMTDVSGAPDVIHDGETGLLVPQRDPQALCRAVEKLAGDEHLRRQLGERGGDYVQTHLSVEKVIPQYEGAYLRALGASAG